MTSQEIINQCTVEGLTVKLPDIKLDRSVYMQVSNILNKIGGTWKGGKIQGFVFEQDPSIMLSDIQSGIKRDIKSEYQFYSTDSKLADEMVELLGSIKPNQKILEPSAGDGALVQAITRITYGVTIDCFEIMELNRKKLRAFERVNLIGENFLDAEDKPELQNSYDFIIANPPFSNNQDIDHIKLMYKLLKPKGKMVSIASKHWLISKNKKEVDFKNWLEDVGAIFKEIPSGAFRKSGTMVATTMIIIDKK